MRLAFGLGALVLAPALACGGGGSKTCPPSCERAPWTRLDRVAGQPGGRGWVDGSLAEAHFIYPRTGALDGAGHLYLADGNMIRAVDLGGGGRVTTLAGLPDTVGGADGV